MNSLEGGRKVLINEIDAQALEIERLFTENKHLAESVLKSKALSEEWERQAQGSLQQNERLQDMLEESAAWSAGERRAGPAGADGAALEAGGDFELRWREESLKCASLEVQLAKSTPAKLHLQEKKALGRRLEAAHAGLSYYFFA